MLICQLSDLHVRPPGQLAYGRVDTADYLRRCVSHVLAHSPRPDVLVITGDLTDRGLPEEYDHLAAMLAPLPMPMYLIPGNHDNRETMRAAFPHHLYLTQAKEFLHYTVSVGPFRIIALDTVLPGEGGGLLCANRLHWLEEQLSMYRNVPKIILMHHPPFTTGIGHMDRVGLRVAYPLEPIVRRHPDIERILCGHLHRTIFRRFGGTIAVTCPSPAHQVLLDLAPDAPSQFIMEPPGYMLHRWTPEIGLTSFCTVIGEYEGPYPFYSAGRLIE